MIQGLVMALGILGAWLGYRALAPMNFFSDPVQRFLARHWARPMAPQGEPPRSFSQLEAALGPEACGSCHADQYRDWRTSLHARTIGPGILWQLRMFSQEEANRCLDCHAPLAEQKALFALERHWRGAPKDPLPSYVSEELHRQGLVCTACHVRRHQRFGPLSKKPDALRAEPVPHSGFSPEKAFGDSRFCSACHQFTSEGKSLAGKLLENTFAEWLTSRAARDGIACQGCHMPDRRHLWRGIHDREMVNAGIKGELTAKRLADGRLAVSATLTNTGVGHYFPTYVVPKVTLSLRWGDTEEAREIAHLVIGRSVSVDLDQELADTRIPPGGQSVLTAEVAAPPGEPRIVMRVGIAPAEHYERMFQAMLERNPGMDPATRNLLNEALLNARASHYRLDDLDLAAPARAGESRRAVAN